MAFQMTARLPDLDNSQTFYARIYEAILLREKDRHSADEARIPQKYQAIGHELGFPLAAISLTTANMDMKLILSLAFQMTPRLPDLDNSQTFYARLYEAFSAQDKDRYGADEAAIPPKYQAIGHELAFPLDDISLIGI